MAFNIEEGKPKTDAEIKERLNFLNLKLFLSDIGKELVQLTRENKLDIKYSMPIIEKILKEVNSEK